ncbi:MAG TPA: flagellar FliJ family protein [Stellaceae bacterium]|nr:flagellar FliJ family protein [Stellaceae bacterium]
MSALKTLIRTHRWQLDERRRYLVDLETLAARLRADAVRLHEEAEAEARAAGLSPEAATAYPGFVRSLIERRRQLDRSVAEVDAQIAEARLAVSAAFEELKRYELVAANRERENRRRLAQRDQRDADALGLQMHGRKVAAGAGG